MLYFRSYLKKQIGVHRFRFDMSNFTPSFFIGFIKKNNTQTSSKNYRNWTCLFLLMIWLVKKISSVFYKKYDVHCSQMHACLTLFLTSQPKLQNFYPIWPLLLLYMLQWFILCSTQCICCSVQFWRNFEVVWCV